MVTIINSVLKNGEDVGLISVRWRDEDGNRQEDVFRHNPYVYLDPANVNQLQSTKEVSRDTSCFIPAFRESICSPSERVAS